MRRRQSGLAAVEFAMVGAAALIILLACIETGRMLFVWNAAAEATRRAARVAVVQDEAAAKAAAMVYANYLQNLTEDNIEVAYYAESGASAPPSEAAFVTVSLTGYEFEFVPAVGLTVGVPAFATTLPVESMGFDPD